MGERQAEEKERIYMEKQRKIREAKEAIEQEKRNKINKMRMEKTEIPKKLRQLCNDDVFRNSHIKSSHIETIAFHASIEQMKSILDNELTKEQQLAKFDEILVIAKAAKKAKKRAEKERKRAAEMAKEKKTGKGWTDDE